MKTPRLAASVLTLLLLPLAAHAGNCKLDINPVTSGFFLNPTLDKLTVRSMKSTKAGFDCKLQQGDEILQINRSQSRAGGPRRSRPIGGR